MGEAQDIGPSSPRERTRNGAFSQSGYDTQGASAEEIAALNARLWNQSVGASFWASLGAPSFGAPLSAPASTHVTKRTAKEPARHEAIAAFVEASEQVGSP